MSKSNNQQSMLVPSLLGIAFVVLKLCGVINWSWWWVTCPFWGPTTLAIVVLILFYVFILIKEVVSNA